MADISKIYEEPKFTQIYKTFLGTDIFTDRYEYEGKIYGDGDGSGILGGRFDFGYDFASKWILKHYKIKSNKTYLFVFRQHYSFEELASDEEYVYFSYDFLTDTMNWDSDWWEGQDEIEPLFVFEEAEQK